MKRRLAREIALQSLYQIEMNGVTPDEAIAAAVNEAQKDNEAKLHVDNTPISTDYAKILVEGTLRAKQWIDHILSNYLKGWRIERLSRIDREILRMAVYELVYREDVPAKVVVNEAIELAKYFGSEESGKFVNGVLGKMIHELPEIRQKRYEEELK